MLLYALPSLLAPMRHAHGQESGYMVINKCFVAHIYQLFYIPSFTLSLACPLTIKLNVCVQQ